MHFRSSISSGAVAILGRQRHLRILLVDFLFHNVQKFPLEHDPLDFGEPVLGRQVDALLVDDDSESSGSKVLNFFWMTAMMIRQAPIRMDVDVPLMLELALLKQVFLLYDFRMLFDGGR